MQYECKITVLETKVFPELQEKYLTQAYNGGSKMINIEDFDEVEVRVGTVLEVTVNKKARHPAYKVKIDFGDEIGTKTSSAQITDLYTPDDLVGKQVVCCVNLQPMHIGSVKSEVRILGADADGGVTLLHLDHPVQNGVRIY